MWLPAPNSSTSLCCRTSKRGRPERRVLEPPTEPHVRRASDRLRGEPDAAGGTRSGCCGRLHIERRSTRAGQGRASCSGAVRSMRRWGQELGSARCPRSADRLATWAVRDAAFYGFDPHFYGWPTPSFQAQVDNVVARMAQAGVGGHPFIINIGGVENPDDPNAKARSISAMCARLRSNTLPGFLFATSWIAQGREREGCGRTVRQFARSLAALPDVLRRRVTHPGSLTGSAEWVRGASRAARGSVVHIPVMSFL